MFRVERRSAAGERAARYPVTASAMRATCTVASSGRANCSISASASTSVSSVTSPAMIRVVLSGSTARMDSTGMALVGRKRDNAVADPLRA